MLLSRSVSSWISQLLACMGGCLGCCAKPTPIIAVDEPSKGLKIQGRTIKKPSASDDFWSTSTYEMENSGVQSQRSISSISMSTQNLDHNGAGSTSNPSEFINHGLLLWNQTRQQWIGNKRPETQLQQVREPRLRMDHKPLKIRNLFWNWKKEYTANFLPPFRFLVSNSLIFVVAVGMQHMTVCWGPTSHFRGPSLYLRW